MLSKSGLWALAIPIAVALGYAILARSQVAESAHGSVASQVLLEMASNSRLQLLIVIPAWVFGSTTAILHATAPRELIRYGTWGEAVLRPLRRCLLIYVSAAGAAIALCGVALYGSYSAGDFPTAILGSFAAVGGDVVLVGFFLVCLYAVLAVANLTSKSSTFTVGFALLICFWGFVSNFSLIDGTSPANAGLYLSMGSALRSGWVPFATVGGALMLIAFTWLLGTAIDARQRKNESAT
ncbi:MAG: hypothetical protein HIU88_12480 [Acidobacteria bacterium]|nr:hypothetical protein [Acidobacteriota bacterium]